MENAICTKKLDKLMLELGIPDNLSGSRYLRCAVVLYAGGLTRMTKELYPEVAKVCGSTASRVERAIRHAVEVSMDRAAVSVLEEVFGATISPYKGKPTNAEYIARLARVCSAD